MRRISFGASDEEIAELDAYCRARHFHNLPEFARVAIFAYMRRNRPGARRSIKHPSGAGESARSGARSPTADI
jgi:hypothetical protein